MNIAFLDDDKQCLKRLTRLAKDIIDKNNVYDFSFNYFEYDNPTVFLEEHKEKKFDAVFLYFEKRHNVVDIITEKEETFIQRISMKELEQNLSNIKFFCRCHSAYIVNLRNIKKFTDKHIIMNNDAQISVSKKYHANLIRKLALIF